jgi:hypothetical protein
MVRGCGCGSSCSGTFGTSSGLERFSTRLCRRSDPIPKGLSRWKRKPETRNCRCIECGNGFGSDSGSRPEYCTYGLPIVVRINYRDSRAETTVAGRDQERWEYELEPDRARET